VTVRFVRLALKVVMQSDRDFVDVILLQERFLAIMSLQKASDFIKM
jgi:hypothetical protein